MNLTALSGPEPTIGSGILPAAAGEGPPFTLPLAFPSAPAPLADGGAKPWRTAVPTLAATLHSDASGLPLSGQLDGGAAARAVVCLPLPAESDVVAATEGDKDPLPLPTEATSEQPVVAKANADKQPTSSKHSLDWHGERSTIDPKAPPPSLPPRASDIAQSLHGARTKPALAAKPSALPSETTREPSDPAPPAAVAPAITHAAPPPPPNVVIDVTAQRHDDASPSAGDPEDQVTEPPVGDDRLTPPSSSGELDSGLTPKAATFGPAVAPRAGGLSGNPPGERPPSIDRSPSAPITLATALTSAAPHRLEAARPSSGREGKRPALDTQTDQPDNAAPSPQLEFPSVTNTASAVSPPLAMTPAAPPPAATAGLSAPPKATATSASAAGTEAPGPGRAHKTPPASPRAAERRSASAERLAEPATASPADPAAPPSSDSKAPANSATPLVDASAAPAPQSPSAASPTPPLAPQAAAPREAPAPAEPQPTPRLHVASPRFAEEVGIAIARRPGGLASGDELVLQIEPANMGRVRVELRFAPGGALEAVVSADQPHVLDQLRANGADLHRSLIEAGGRADIAPPRFEARADSSLGLPSQGGQTHSGGNGQPGQQGGHGQQGSRAALPYPFDPATTPAATQHFRSTAVTGRLDLLA